MSRFLAARVCICMISQRSDARLLDSYRSRGKVSVVSRANNERHS